MEEFTVYHIPGIKFGCTMDMTRRRNENKNRYGDVEMIIIKTFTNVDEASEFEEFCNQEAGYITADSGLYSETLKRNRNPNRCKAISDANKGNQSWKHRGPITDETRQLMSDSNTGSKNGMYGKTRTKGFKFMTDGTNDTMIHPDKIDEYLKMGWRLGRVKHK